MKIGFVGEMASGKSFFADYFIEKYGGIKLSFAQQLKEDVVTLDLLPDGIINKARDRSLLQDYGQLRRGELKHMEANGHVLECVSGSFMYDGVHKGFCNPEYWSYMGAQKARSMGDLQNIVFDDLRFSNEVHTLMRVGFTIIRIYACKESRIERLIQRDGGYDVNNFNNVSETETLYLPINYMIENDDDNASSLQIFDEILKRKYNLL